MEGSERGATSSGHALIRDVGGSFTHMHEIWLYAYATPDYRDPTSRRGLVFRGTPGSVWLRRGCAAGERLVVNAAALLVPAIFSGRVAGGWAAPEAGFGPRGSSAGRIERPEPDDPSDPAQ